MKARSPYFLPISLALVVGTTASAMASCGPTGGTGFQDDDGSTSSGSSGGSSSGGSSGSDDATTSSSSGTSSGTSSSSSGGSSGSSSSSPSTPSDASLLPATDGHYVPTCGRPCDERSNTCCVPDDGGAAWCLSGTTANCGTNAATLHCAGASDCSSGNVCCGNYDLNALTAQTFCQKPGCPVAQFCETDTECPTGVRCTPQTCGKVMLYMCGLMSKAPYNCVAN